MFEINHVNKTITVLDAQCNWYVAEQVLPKHSGYTVIWG